MRNILKKIFLVFFLMTTSAAFATSILSPLTDTVNTGIINTKIALDSSLSDLDVDVTVNHGVATLRGNVNTEAQVKKLVQTVRSVSGINGVDISNLKIRNTNQPISDAQITLDIKSLYLQEKLFGTASVPVISISVTTTNGVVYLTGTADNQDQLNNAIRLAKSVRGVKKVESQVMIKK